MDTKKYFIAFLDILGFKEIISNIERVNEIITTIEGSTQNIKKGTSGIYPAEEIEFKYQSDSIILYIPYPDDEKEKYKCLRYLIYATQLLQLDSAAKNIWIRGGISFGNLLINTRVVVGDGLLKAYKLEQSAIYPRVLIDNEFISNFNLSSKKNLIDEMRRYNNLGEYQNRTLILKSNEINPENSFSALDEYMFVDYFCGLNTDKQKIKIILNHIKLNLNNNNDPQITKKHLWTKYYLLNELKKSIDINEYYIQTLDEL
jgi:hypothetical protein